MNKYNDLELSILSCLLKRPELMKQVKFEDKHFIKHKKIWLFMKAFYQRFKNFDPTLMVSVSNNKYRMIEYIIWIIDKEPAPSLFNQYQEQLIDLYNQKKKDKWIIENLYELANDLYVGNVELKDYKKEVDEIFRKGNEVFKDEK